MSPTRSTARLGMKRKNVFAPSGSYVAPWTTLAATVPPGDVHLVPAHRRVAARCRVATRVRDLAALHGVVDPQRLGAADVRVLGLHHRPDREHVGRVGRGRARSRGVAFGQQFGASCVIGPGERRRRDLVPVDVELVDRERVQELLGRDEVLGRAGRRRAGLEPRVRRDDREVGVRRRSRRPARVGAPAYICCLLSAQTWSR